MRRREDKRSTFTRVLQAVGQGLFVTGLAFLSGSLFAGIGIPARVLGVVAAMGITGATVFICDGLRKADERDREEELRAIELENQKADEHVAEMGLVEQSPPLLGTFEQLESGNFTQRVENQRRETYSRTR